MEEEGREEEAEAAGGFLAPVAPPEAYFRGRPRFLFTLPETGAGALEAWPGTGGAASEEEEEGSGVGEVAEKMPLEAVDAW